MKILIIQERGRHEANRDFRESCCLKRSFDHLGHDASIWGKGHESFGSAPDFNSYDLIVNLENYGDDWMPDLSSVTKPFKVIWCIDAHVRGAEPYERIYQQGKYDILAHSTRDFVRFPHHRWLPNCADHRIIVPMTDVPKTHRIGFCGNHVTPERASAVNTLTQIFGLKQDIFVIGNDMVKAINSYRIHFNMNISNDINYRSFETLACNTVLLTNNNPQYADLGFQDGVNCLMYQSRESRDVIMGVTQALNRDANALADIANRGYQLLLARHTYDHRASDILGFLNRG